MVTPYSICFDVQIYTVSRDMMLGAMDAFWASLDFSMGPRDCQQSVVYISLQINSGHSKNPQASVGMLRSFN